MVKGEIAKIISGNGTPPPRLLIFIIWRSPFVPTCPPPSITPALPILPFREGGRMGVTGGG